MSKQDISSFQTVGDYLGLIPASDSQKGGRMTVFERSKRIDSYRPSVRVESNLPTVIVEKAEAPMNDDQTEDVLTSD